MTIQERTTLSKRCKKRGKRACLKDVIGIQQGLWTICLIACVPWTICPFVMDDIPYSHFFYWSTYVIIFLLSFQYVDTSRQGHGLGT